MSSPSTHMPLIASLVLLVVVTLASIPVTGSAVGSFSGAHIELRSWHEAINAVLSVAHATLLVIGALGLARAAATAGGRKAAFGVAALCWGLALLTSLVLPAVPWSAEPGPWPPESATVAFLRVAVFLPAIPRSVGCLALVATLPRRAAWLYVALAIDVGLCIYVWWTSPYATIARLHPCVTTPWLLAPWLTSMVGLVAYLVAELRSFSSPSPGSRRSAF